MTKLPPDDLETVGNVKMEVKQKEKKNWQKSRGNAQENILGVCCLGKS